MKFETINGTLCRMVEPTPLTNKAQFPCVVRLIQDDSPMGRYNKAMETADTLRRTVTALRVFSNSNVEAKDILLPAGNYYNRFEILGYPVAEGSKEWALYQIRSGKKVVKEGGGERYVGSFYKNRLFYLNDYDCLVTKNAIGLIDPCSEEEFLDLDKTGWQLYEPQPEPEPAFKAGDWVTDGAVQGRMVTRTSDTTWVEMQDGKQYHIETSHLRKLDPSEVIVNIGCLKGTVTYAVSNDCFLLAKVHDPQHRACCIDMSMLDTATRELVESLLKAQGGAE